MLKSGDKQGSFCATAATVELLHFVVENLGMNCSESAPFLRVSTGT